MLKSVNMRVEESLYEEFKQLTKGESITAALTRLIRKEVDYKRLKLKDDYPRVIRIIDGKKYDTDTARRISEKRYNDGLITILYRKKNGELYMHCYVMGGGQTLLPDIMTKKHAEYDDYLSEMNVDEHSAEEFEE